MARLFSIAKEEKIDKREEELDSYEEQFKDDVTALKIDSIRALIYERGYIGFYLSYDINGNSSVYENINNNIRGLCSEHIKYKEFTNSNSTNGIILCDSDESENYDNVFTKIQTIFEDIKKDTLKKIILIQLLDNGKWFIKNTQ